MTPAAEPIISQAVSTVIAIDGPTASGKGTLARRLGDALGFRVLDTGLLYRAVGLSVARGGGNPADPLVAIPAARALDATKLAEDNEIRSDVAGQYASQCSVIPEVRAALLDFQRQFAQQEPGAILDGRDIGTVVCPGAKVKFYITASAEARAKRRHAELISRGKDMTYEQVLEDIRIRDDRDMNRAIAPLRPAEGSVTLDTTNMNADQAFVAALAVARARLGLVTELHDISLR